jgi:A/G-specific adenine glycosylase
VLAIGFGRPVAALDVNIRRILGRAFVGANMPPRKFQAMADGCVPAGQSAAWTHALMDIGAAFCRPREPRCDACPLQAGCAYRAIPGGAVNAASTARSLEPRPTPRFESTSRWLRGRILDRLRDTPHGEWLAFDGAIGRHDAQAVSASLARLSAEGMIELDGGRARLAPE